MGLLQMTFYSRVLEMQTNMTVILPTRFENDEIPPAGKGFQTLYILHGGTDDCTYYVRNTNIERYATEHKLAVVFPEVQMSFYSDMRHGQKFLTYITEEVPAVAQSLFPLSTKREDHFVLGNSMGSHGSAKWALNKPDFFNAIAGMSGLSGLPELGFIGENAKYNFPGLEDSFGTYDDYIGSKNDLKFLAKKLLDEGRYIPRIFSCCGTEDFTYPGCVDFKNYAAQIGLPFTFEDGPGAHTWEFWDDWMKRIFTWFELKNDYVDLC